MFLSFAESKNYIENEFEEANWDISSGLPIEVIKENAWKMFCESQETMPILRARIYEYIMDNTFIEINPHTPFAAKFNIGVSYEDYATQDFVQTDIYKQALENMRKKYLSEKDYYMQHNIQDCGLAYACTDFWHTVPDWNNILKYGIAGLLANAEESKKTIQAMGDGYEKNIEFLDSVIICFKAMKRMMERIHRASMKYDIPEFTECIEKLMKRAPQTLYEVMQTAILFLYFEEIGPERGRSLGPIDRLYMPYYENDIKNGIKSEKQDELFRFFFMHFTAAKRFAQQPILLCGSDENGNTLCNELTNKILDIYDSMNILDPKIHIRYHESMPEKTMLKILDMIRRGNNSICIFNDEAVFNSYKKMGIPLSDSKDYVPLGCYEPIIMGLEEAEIGASWFNISKPLEFIFNNGKDILTDAELGLPCKESYNSFEEFMSEYYRQLDYSMDFIIRMINTEGEHSTEVNPSPIYSATLTECINKGMDVHEYPLKYNNISIKCMGLATLVDSLYAVKKYVFDTKELSYEQMQKAILSNWQGFESIRGKISNDNEKYGNNIESVDAVMKQVVNHLVEKYAYKKIPRGGVLRLGTDSITYCIDYGRASAATPNGRKNGENLSRNLCAEEGKDKNGILSLMQSLLKVDATDFVDSFTLDFNIHPSAVSGDKGLVDFYNLVKTYFRHGGYAMQGNVVNADELKKAKISPEQYSTLQIRVCGWNEYFVNMDEVKQDMFIRSYSV